MPERFGEHAFFAIFLDSALTPSWAACQIGVQSLDVRAQFDCHARKRESHEQSGREAIPQASSRTMLLTRG
jgi:hypothetical protein